ncbi:alpha-xylosidase [bacterium BMS3Abin05]|nr:alpha-xylosidase [bacterium BMS3Abin05]
MLKTRIFGSGLLILFLPALLFADTIGKFQSYRQKQNRIQLNCINARVDLVFWSRDIVQVLLFTPSDSKEEPSLVVSQDSMITVQPVVTNQTDILDIRCGDLILTVRKNPFRISYRSAAADFHLKGYSDESFAWGLTERSVSFDVSGSSHDFYGLGEKSIPINRWGWRIIMENTAHYGYEGEAPTLNINIPFLLSPDGYGLYFDTPSVAVLDAGATSPNILTYSIDMGQLKFFVIAGESPAEILLNYTHLTGRQPLPPRWALGYIQSKYGYRSEAEARTIVSMFRQKEIPLDAIVLDLYWYGQPRDMGNMTWNKAAWPTSAQMIADFRSRGVKTILIEEPYITTQSFQFSTADQNHYFGENENGQSIVIPNFWAGPAALLDFTNPVVQEWWWGLNKPLLDQGVAGLWTDLGEPEIQPSNMVFALGNRDYTHNIYNLLWAKSLFERFRRDYPNRRFFNLTRSGFAGMQKYSTFPWSGDVRKSFAGLQVQLPIMLGMGLSGVGYSLSDISGFEGQTTQYLYLRWMEFGLFSPVMRVHSGGQSVEPWVFGNDVEKIAKSLIRLRYQFLPYNYTLAYENYRSGMPLARALVLALPEDPNARNNQTEYFWGKDLLVAPVTTPFKSRQSVYFPEGEWINFWDDSVISGSKNITVDAAIDRIPVFVRRGAILPTQGAAKSTEAVRQDSLILEVYSGSSGAGRFYEDDGRSLDYQNGQLAITQFKMKATSTLIQLTVNTGEGTFKGQPQNRIYVSKFHLIEAAPDSVKIADRVLPVFNSKSSLLFGKMGSYYDSNRKILWTKLRVSIHQDFTITISGKKLLTSIANVHQVTAGFLLYQNYPNPFNAMTTIRYKLPKLVYVTLTIYNVQGRKITVIIEGEQKAGIHSIQWKANRFPSGLYLYRLEAGDFVKNGKMILLK